MSREGGTSFHAELQMVMEHKLGSFFTSARCPIEDMRYAVLRLETYSTKKVSKAEAEEMRIQTPMKQPAC